MLCGLLAEFPFAQSFVSVSVSVFRVRNELFGIWHFSFSLQPLNLNLLPFSFDISPSAAIFLTSSFLIDHSPLCL
jgi:hypothetical protein